MIPSCSCNMDMVGEDEDEDEVVGGCVSTINEEEVDENDDSRSLTSTVLVTVD